MLPITHLLAPLVILSLFYRYRGTRASANTLVLAGFFGVLPDLLNLHISLAERASWSHSFLILPVIAVFAVVAGGRIQRYARLALLGFTVHIVLDLLSNPYNFFYPLSFTPPSYPVLSQCGFTTFICWYSVDVVLVLAAAGLIYLRLVREA